MKKVALILILFFSLLGSGCGYIRYAKYPKIDLSNYEGQRYISGDIMFDRDGYFMIYDNRVIVGRYLNLLSCWSIAYFSNRDTEKNWLQGNGYNQAYANCLKEGFKLPNILETDILEARIPCRNIRPDYSIGVKVQEDDIVIRFTDGIRIVDILDIENPCQGLKMSKDPKSCYFVLKEDSYLAWGSYSGIVDYNNELYFEYFGVSFNSDARSVKYYPIKDEYQETFRNAINELNNT